jgi:hypothetical protein
MTAKMRNPRITAPAPKQEMGSEWVHGHCLRIVSCWYTFKDVYSVSVKEQECCQAALRLRRAPCSRRVNRAGCSALPPQISGSMLARPLAVSGVANVGLTPPVVCCVLRLDYGSPSWRESDSHAGRPAAAKSPRGDKTCRYSSTGRDAQYNLLFVPSSVANLNSFSCRSGTNQG